MQNLFYLFLFFISIFILLIQLKVSDPTKKSLDNVPNALIDAINHVLSAQKIFGRKRNKIMQVLC